MSERENDIDPGGLIREAYRIDGIGIIEARSIFLDWAIKREEPPRTDIAIRRLLGLYGDLADANHPMTAVLREGLSQAAAQGRRGGSRARRGA